MELQGIVIEDAIFLQGNGLLLEVYGVGSIHQGRPNGERLVPARAGRARGGKHHNRLELGNRKDEARHRGHQRAGYRPPGVAGGVAHLDGCDAHPDAGSSPSAGCGGVDALADS